MTFITGLILGFCLAVIVMVIGANLILRSLGDDPEEDRPGDFGEGPGDVSASLHTSQSDTKGLRNHV